MYIVLSIQSMTQYYYHFINVFELNKYWIFLHLKIRAQQTPGPPFMGENTIFII